MGKDAKDYTRQEVYDLVKNWIDNGKLICSCKQEITNNEKDRKSNKREWSYTRLKRVMFVGDSRGNTDYYLFDKLIREDRIMSPLTAKVKKDLRTLYQLQKAAMNGELLRIERDGIILYID